MSRSPGAASSLRVLYPHGLGLLPVLLATATDERFRVGGVGTTARPSATPPAPAGSA
ncbi:MAG: hypothetical protein ACREQM_22395 [Candidatus Dormibacteraceae bacterium]